MIDNQVRGVSVTDFELYIPVKTISQIITAHIKQTQHITYFKTVKKKYFLHWFKKKRILLILLTVC